MNFKSASESSRSYAITQSQTNDFLTLFPDILKSIEEDENYSDVKDSLKWITEVLQYNIIGGKYNRAMFLVSTYKDLQKPKTISSEDLRLVNVCGWCLEMFQGYLCILDDIMDNSLKRRGADCWYRVDNIGLSAINDAILVQSAMYHILKKNFHDKPYFLKVLEQFNEVTMKTSIGQYLDLTMTFDKDKPDFSKFTMQTYKSIVKYKAAYYTLQLPVRLAMLISEFDDVELQQKGDDILMQMGEFFQIQDDFLDCYGDPAVMGKVGSDIQSGKCSWLAVVALQRANSAQKKIMEDYYGSSEPAAVERIKALYTELNLPDTYTIYEEESLKIIMRSIKEISKGKYHGIFVNIIDKLYKRKS